MTGLPSDISEVTRLLAGSDYVADRALSTVVFLALKLGASALKFCHSPSEIAGSSMPLRPQRRSGMVPS